jgi:carbon starvation protein
MFGISNQLLAAVALSVGTTLLVRNGKARYAWTTLLPLTWLLAVTSTASWEKIFSADPHLGFLSHASQTANGIASGTIVATQGSRLIFNDRLDAALCAIFLLITWAVVISSARVWLGQKHPEPVESAAEAVAA